MLKALFIVEIFTFLSWLFGYLEKWLDKKVKVNSNNYDITDKTPNIITIHILPNISRCKNNQAVKFGHIIECDMIFFFENNAKNEAGRLVPDLFCFLKMLYIR